MPKGNETDNQIKTAVNVFEIIETIRGLRGATLTQLSEELAVPKSTLHAYLSTLEGLEYVDRYGDEYDLSLRFLDLGIYSRNRIEMVSESNRVLKELAKETREVVWLTVESHGRVVYIETERDSKSVRTYEELGNHEYMHCCAAGKAILAHLPKNRVSEVINQHGLPAKTENTITESNELLDELERIRNRGYAMNDQETADGISAISAPVLVDDIILGSVTVAGSANRIKGDAHNGEIVRLVQSASDEIALNMKYS